MSETNACGDFFLGRQPILDRDQRLIAYELLFRSSAQNAASFADGVAATATVIANAFTELSVADSLGDCLGFINVDEEFLFSDLLELLPREHVVLEILETVPPTPDVIERCNDLRAEGYRLALDDIVHSRPEYRELMELAEFIKVDVKALAPGELETLTVALRPLGKTLLAEKVDSLEQKEACMALGYSLFQGYFFAKPIIITGKKLSHSQVTLMTLLGLLMADADTSELEAAFKHEPGLTVNLLRMTNSVGAGTLVQITSLRHAITVLGQRQLQRWLQLLLFAATGNQGTTSPLLQLAATRGRLMELLAEHTRKGDRSYADQAFMVGIMSLMPALVGLPMAEIIAPLSVTPEVRDALCDAGGSLGLLLRLTAAAEEGGVEDIALCIAAIAEINPGTFNHCLTQAMAWAGNIGKDKPET